MDNKAGFASMHLVQWTPGWATATFDQGPWINAFSVEQRLAVPSTVQGWWLDDVYFPRGEGWWEDTEVRITTELSRAESTVYWIAVYANTPGFDTVNRLGGQWLRAAASDGLPLWLGLRPDEIPARPDFQRANERLCNGEDYRGLVASDEPSAGNVEKAGDKTD
ncbi:hypothetical protein PF008_g24109 [Phytophthora fragariae]|uniref:Uncharacterized protein n=1 Tax=Phytophthora fragariae TaxID=53985 RepID=A0A6G0QPH4_9STRA|nr:hypothetical protein PF008_g24109 [Phytophthora fragariae]